MATVLVAGSTTGLGLAAAREMLDHDHRVILHAGTAARAESVRDLVDDRARIGIADLADLDATRTMADAVNQLGDVDPGWVPTCACHEIDSQRTTERTPT